MKILKLLLVYVNVLFGSEIILENQLEKEVKINGIELGKTTSKGLKGKFGFDLEMYKVKDSYDGKLYNTKNICIEDKQKGVFLLISSSRIPSSFLLIDIFEVSYMKDKSVIGLKCHEDTIKFKTQNYLGYTREQIINIFGINYEKRVEYKVEQFSYRIEKEIKALYENKLRVLYPSKGISFYFKDNRVIKYSVDALMEYGEYINDEKLCERVQNKQLLSEKDFLKIINNNAIYKLNECELNLNARVDIRSSPTFLIQAIRHKKYKIIQYLLDNKADIEGMDGDNNTPLFVAIGNKDKKAIRLLLKYNPNILVKNDEGKSAKEMLKEININIPKFMVTPKFQNYLVKNIYENSSQSLIQKDFGRLYRTLLKKALKEKKPEFAGKYIIAQWGCDEGKNECTTGGIIDASTGKATEFPFKYYAHNGSKEIIYKLDSSLIIFAGDFEFKDGRKEINKVLFYDFKNGEFLFLKSKGYGK